jgi:nitroreductase
MEKSVEFQYPVSILIKNRKSVLAFSDLPVTQECVYSLFEATRWAPSSSNEQPWRYIYALRDQPELWGLMLDCLNASNKIWAKSAAILILSLTRKNFTKFSTENPHALYDLGAANAFLSLQAVELGLQVRQMAGYDKKMVIQKLNIPDEYQLGVFIAVGFPGDPKKLPDNLMWKELGPRERFLQHSFVMNSAF